MGARRRHSEDEKLNIISRCLRMRSYRISAEIIGLRGIIDS